MMENTDTLTGRFLDAVKLHEGLRDEIHKPEADWHFYAKLLGRYQLQPLRILDIGVYRGLSTVVLASAFPTAKVVGVDLQIPIEAPSLPNLVFHTCDQRDEQGLQAIIDLEFDGCVDFVIEDASHFGRYSQRTFGSVFPRLKSGGIYAIEDWPTGYFEDWPDGSKFRSQRLDDLSDSFDAPLTSHHFGMVGFVKSLVDHVGIEIDKAEVDPVVWEQLRISELGFWGNVAYAVKP